RLDDGRTLLYLVSGGGGAFMHETHSIPNLDASGLAGWDKERFGLYPLRADSLSRFSQLYGRKLWLPRALLFIAPDQAAAIVGKRLGIAPTRTRAREGPAHPRGRDPAA